MNTRERPFSRDNLLRTILTLFFIYGGLSYGLSLLEYNSFLITGKAVFGVQQRYDSLSEDQLKQAFLDCGTHLMGATGVNVSASGEPVVVRCGRFWPFYRYSLEVPAQPEIPGVLIASEDQPPGMAQAHARLVHQVRLVAIAWMTLSVLISAMALYALWLLYRRDLARSLRWGTRAFVSSVLMTLLYLAVMFAVNPLFRYGW
ncbi:hypothetical protein QQM79_04275 [Marinobacteraceae bacterium S3BR75-40.1]